MNVIINFSPQKAEFQCCAYFLFIKELGLQCDSLSFLSPVGDKHSKKRSVYAMVCVLIPQRQQQQQQQQQQALFA